MRKLLLLSVIGLSVGFAPLVLAETMTVVSDTNVAVYGPLYSEPSGLNDPSWGSSSSAVAAWVHSFWPSISGATWISTSYLVEESAPDSWRKFHVDLALPTGACNITGTLEATADNAEIVYLNGSLVGSNGDFTVVTTYPMNPTPGTNSLDFIVKNYAYGGGPYSNPTGLIFKAVISYDLRLEVDIDIKPGSDPNSVNLGSEGVIPIAILGSESFDVHDIDQTSLEMAGNAAREKGKSGKIGSFEDANSDGHTDLVVQIPVEGLSLTEDDTEATITGLLNDGTAMAGTDAIRIVPSDQ